MWKDTFIVSAVVTVAVQLIPNVNDALSINELPHVKVEVSKILVELCHLNIICKVFTLNVLVRFACVQIEML